MTAQDDDEPASLGSCCICETYFGVRNIVMLDRRAPIAGHGWGCVVCGLPSDGAVAVLCDGCLELFQAGGVCLFACRGYPAKDGRVPFADLSPEPFGHDEAKHQQDEEDGNGCW